MSLIQQAAQQLTDKTFADAIRGHYPLAAAMLDHQRCPDSTTYARYVGNIDRARRARSAIPSAF